MFAVDQWPQMQTLPVKLVGLVCFSHSRNAVTANIVFMKHDADWPTFFGNVTFLNVENRQFGD